ncbi:hypothetical protein CL656_07080 [bacterium]|nr:hypothetical protein [bacterium]|tara:strand:+ start:70 stop:315 length:246 start_codon:yes stop_codon:yes gene_type:complete
MNVEISKMIDLKYFILSLCLGLLYLYLMDESKEVVIIHPTPYTVKDYLFKDFLNNCYELNMKEVSCYENEYKVEKLPKNDF